MRWSVDPSVNPPAYHTAKTVLITQTLYLLLLFFLFCCTILLNSSRLGRGGSGLKPVGRCGFDGMVL